MSLKLDPFDLWLNMYCWYWRMACSLICKESQMTSSLWSAVRGLLSKLPPEIAGWLFDLKESINYFERFYTKTNLAFISPDRLNWAEHVVKIDPKRNKYCLITECWKQLLPTTPFIRTINYFEQTWLGSWHHSLKWPHLFNKRRFSNVCPTPITFYKECWWET